MSSFHSLERRNPSDYGLLPVTTGFTMTTVSHGLCVCRSEAGDPAALRFSMTHNINHFIEVGQILLEILLKCGGTAQAGGRHCAWERLTRPPPAAGSVSQQQQLALWLKTATESRQDQRARTSLLSELRLTSGNIRWRESTVSLSCTLITDSELTLAC